MKSEPTSMVIFSVELELLAQVLPVWENILASAGLSIEREKFQFYQPRGNIPRLCEPFSVGEHRAADQGFIVCGYLLQRDDLMQQQQSQDHALPMGSQEYQTAFLKKKLDAYEVNWDSFQQAPPPPKKTSTFPLL